MAISKSNVALHRSRTETVADRAYKFRFYIRLLKKLKSKADNDFPSFERFWRFAKRKD